MAGLLKFAGSSEDYLSSKFVIFGAPFDSTTSFRSGQRFGPNRIREASSTLERFIYERKMNVKEAGLHDMGDLESTVNPEKMKGEVAEAVRKLLKDRKFPIMLGGEHSVTIGASESLHAVDASVLFLDAHSDFRTSLLGEKLSHGTVARHTVETLGLERVGAIGLRAISQEEYQDQLFPGYNFFTSEDVRRAGVREILDRLMKKMKSKRIYLSLDLDVIDPAFAPGVSTPEPFGLDSFQIKELINIIGNRLIGADIVELDPPYDNGNTAILAARFVQEILASASCKE